MNVVNEWSTACMKGEHIKDKGRFNNDYNEAEVPMRNSIIILLFLLECGVARKGLFSKSYLFIPKCAK